MAALDVIRYELLVINSVLYIMRLWTMISIYLLPKKGLIRIDDKTSKKSDASSWNEGI